MESFDGMKNKRYNHNEIFNSLKKKKNIPTAIICKTIKGKGINYGI